MTLKRNEAHRGVSCAEANLLNKKHTIAHVMNSTLRVVSIALLMLMIASVPAIEGNSGGKHNQASAGLSLIHI
mgnify:CR=1 FL=1